MVALRVAVAPPVEPHYAEQLLRSALASAHGASLADALAVESCERCDDATVVVVAVDAARLVDVRGALALAGGDAEASVRVEASADAAADLPPRDAAAATVPLRPSSQLLVELWR